ncbi:MAG: aspartate/glutamate racemase family protein, partial [Pseudonocardiaceae bacterium]
LLLCTNTMHKVADQVQEGLTIPLLNLLDVTASAVTHVGIDTVGLLATRFTMEEDFYRERFGRHGLRVIAPEPADRAEVNRIIYDELCRGIISDESRRTYRGVIGRLIAAGAAGIILGCTEVELLVTAKDSDVPVFPTTALHVRAAVDAALADGPPGSAAG